MKANKIAILISGLITILSVFGAIFLPPWWQNISFAIFGSGFLSLTISFVTYSSYLKKNIEEIVMSAYLLNLESSALLYTKSKDISLKSFQIFLSTFTKLSYAIYYKLVQFDDALLTLSRTKKRLLKEIESDLATVITEATEAGYYIDIFEEEANAHTSSLYKDFDSTLEKNDIYLKALRLAKMFGSKVTALQKTYPTQRNRASKGLGEQYRKKMANLAQILADKQAEAELAKNIENEIAMPTQEAAQTKESKKAKDTKKK